MKKIITALASAACLLCAASAHASVYKFEFAATNFPISNGQPAPETSVAGWIKFTADSLGAPVSSIDAVGLTIAGHKYTPGEIGAIPENYNNYLFGGTEFVVYGINAGTNDFYVTDMLLGYAVFGTIGIWQSFTITSSYTELISEVPEPGSLALLLAGAGGIYAMRRRRRF
jgi:hypothetical protein